MKNCPKCQAKFEDDMSFCLQDGTKLVEFETASEAVTEEWTNSIATKATLIRPREDATEQFSAPATNVESEPKSTMSGFLIGVAATIGLLLVGSAIGGIIWYFGGQNTYETSSVKTNQTANVNSNNLDEKMRAELSNAALPENSNRDEVNSKVNSNSETAPTVTPKSDETIAPDKSPTPTAKPTPKPTIDEITPPTPKPTPTRPLGPISGGVLNGKATSLPKPQYPPAARAANAKGSVSVQVMVDENGNVRRARATSGHLLLRNAAERAAQQAKFSPTEVNGQAVKVTGVIIYTFN